MDTLGRRAAQSMNWRRPAERVRVDHSEQAAGLVQEAAGVLVERLAQEWETVTGADLRGIERCLQAVLRGADGALVAGLAPGRLAVPVVAHSLQ